MAHHKVSHLSRIDAEASSIFDTNAPIDTPPIFNTVSSHNSANIYTGTSSAPLKAASVTTDQAVYVILMVLRTSMVMLQIPAVISPTDLLIHHHC